MENNKKTNNSDMKLSDQAIQLYLDLGLDYLNDRKTAKKHRRSINFKGTGVGFSKNILNREVATKPKSAKEQLGGKSVNKKTGVRQVPVVMDPETMHKFTADCKMRGQTTSFRLASIVSARYQSYFENGDHAAQVNIVSTGQHAHTDLLRRSGNGARRSLKVIRMTGIYATKFYDVLCKICLDNNMSMSCFIGSLLEAEYKNYNLSKKMQRTVVDLESRILRKSLPEVEKDFEKSMRRGLRAGTVINTRSKTEKTFYRDLRIKARQQYRRFEKMGINPQNAVAYVPNGAKLDPVLVTA